MLNSISNAAALPFRYVISGLTVHSDVELRSAIASEHDGEPDVAIHHAMLPPVGEGTDGAFPVRIPSTGRFVIRQGREIAYETFAGYDPGELALHLIGTCFTILLQQRGYMVLHGSAISVHDRAVLFCGASGAGKSTLAAMLCRRGYPLLNDDVCSISETGDGRFAVHPDGRMLKLWRGSLHELKEQPTGAPVSSLTDKFYLAPPTSDKAARPLQAIYFLHTSEPGSAPEIHLVSPAQAILRLRENAYRPGLVDAMGQSASFFKASAALCRGTTLYQLSRPKDFARAETVLDLLEAAWAAMVASTL
jgi:hypothetical protein